MVIFELRADIGYTITIHRTRLIQKGRFIGFFEFLSSAKELSNNFYENAKLLEAQTGIVVSETSRIGASSRVFRVYPTNISWPPSLPRTEGFRYTLVQKTLNSILQGTYAYNGAGSRILMPRINQTFDSPGYFSLESQEIAIAKYTGSVLPAFGAIIVAAVLFLVYVVAKICLNDPPGLGWEVITAHGRKCADKLLTGPRATRWVTWSRQEEEETNCYIGYGVPQGYYPVDEFKEGDEIGAAPFGIS